MGLGFWLNRPEQLSGKPLEAAFVEAAPSPGGEEATEREEHRSDAGQANREELSHASCFQRRPCHSSERKNKRFQGWIAALPGAVARKIAKWIR